MANKSDCGSVVSLSCFSLPGPVCSPRHTHTHIVHNSNSYIAIGNLLVYYKCGEEQWRNVLEEKKSTLIVDAADIMGELATVENVSAELSTSILGDRSGVCNEYSLEPCYHRNISVLAHSVEQMVEVGTPLHRVWLLGWLFMLISM